MRLSNTAVGMKSCEGENDKTGKPRHCNSAEPHKCTRVALGLRTLSPYLNDIGVHRVWCLYWKEPHRKEQLDIS